MLRLASVNVLGGVETPEILRGRDMTADELRKVRPSSHGRKEGTIWFLYNKHMAASSDLRKEQDMPETRRSRRMSCKAVLDLSMYGRVPSHGGAGKGRTDMQGGHDSKHDVRATARESLLRQE